MSRHSQTDAPLPFELDALAGAHRYQAWVAKLVLSFLGERILEVGAGIGSMSNHLPARKRLILSEMEPALLERLRHCEAAQRGAVVHAFDIGTGAGLEAIVAEAPDTIVSFNVLEHIENDEAALGCLLSILKQSTAPGPKRLVTFVPAHPFAFNAMDRRFGHHRRYDLHRIRFLASRVAPRAQLQTRFFNALSLPGWWFQGNVLGRDRIGSASVSAFEAVAPLLTPIDDFLHDRLHIPFGQSLLFVLTLPGAT
ncbi:MAG: methyltransferase domain-containing protein [Deltaproteobacteria bacterium]|nr:methyltransferase domain-containing protein [Deltaproteobacteria bacterium]